MPLLGPVSGKAEKKKSATLASLRVEEDTKPNEAYHTAYQFLLSELELKDSKAEVLSAEVSNF